jgi:transcriptional regulator with PAS, ATPase and Fis domain
LRVLQDNRVMSVGDDQEVFVDFRIIAATNRNLEWEIEQGEFRADLFHRINVLSLFLCPLRERIADIKPLIEQVLVKYRSIEASSSVLVGQDFIEAVASLKLSGNARELENLVLRALLNKQDNTPLGLNDLPSDIWQQLYAQQICPTKPLPSCEISEILNTSQPSPMELESLIKWLDSNGWDLNHAINYCERLVLEAALHQTHGNQTESANLLGITPRSVYSKLRKHHLGH